MERRTVGGRKKKEKVEGHRGGRKEERKNEKKRGAKR